METYLLHNKYLFNNLITMYEWVEHNDIRLYNKWSDDKRYETYEFRDVADLFEWLKSNKDIEIMF